MENKHAQDDVDYLSTSKAAAILGVHPQTLRRYEAEGLVTPAFRTKGGERRYLRSTIVAFRDAQGAEVGA